ncbi:MAG TPA: hypothetical protein VE173_16825, partial [Longimicrobiales bacterium]|nr:hypothetical protein [Longimicrobiales bacterium]
APLRGYGPTMAEEPVVLFPPAPAIRSGRNATVSYWLRQPVDSLTIEILEADGDVVRTFQGVAEEEGERGGRGAAAGGRGGGGGFGRGGGRDVPDVTPGLHTVTWDLRYPDATTFEGMILWGATTSGPAAVPGTYQVRLRAGGVTRTEPLAVRINPLYDDVTQADLQAQFDLAIRIRDKVSEANEAVLRIRRVRDDVEERLAGQDDDRLRESAERLTAALGEVEEAIYQVRNRSGQDPLNFPIKINNRLASLLRAVTRGDGRPIAVAEPIFDDLVEELKVQTDRLDEVVATDLASFNAEARRLGLDEVEGS